MGGKPKGNGTDVALDTVRQPKKRAYLAALAETGNRSIAARAAGVARSTIYTPQWREDEVFVTAEMQALEIAADALEEEARRRAVLGVEEPVGWYRGEPGGTVTRYSDTLLIFLLKGLRPQKYRERWEFSGPGGGPIPVMTVVVNRDGKKGREVGK